MSHTFRSVFILLLIMGSAFGQQVERLETVAVLDLIGNGVSNIEAELLTNRFSTTLAQTNKLQLVERKEMDNILEEQDFQNSGCTDASCAVEIGKMLNVKYMIGGSIGKLGSTYTIDIKMFSVESGKIAKAAGQTYKGDIDGLIAQVERSAWLIVDLEPPAALTVTQGVPQGPVKPPNLKLGAAMRSTLIPGFGQFSRNKKILGSVWLVSEIGLGMLFLSAKSNYDTAIADQAHYTSLYEQTSDITEITTYRELTLEANDRSKAASSMKTMMGVSIGVLHIANIAHAYLTGGVATPDSEPPTEISGDAGFKLQFSPIYSGISYEIPLF